jgi:FixJ family two-component response regulator
MLVRAIAVVDDDLAVRKSLSRLLRAAGFVVSAYASREEFLGRPPENVRDCLLVNVGLAGMSGLERRMELVHRGVKTADDD